MNNIQRGMMTALLALGALPSQAGQYWWSGDGVNLGGNGTWDTSAKKWRDGSESGSFTNWPNGGGDTACFSTNTGAASGTTVTLNGTMNVNGLYFMTSTTLTSGVLNFGSAGGTINLTTNGNTGNPMIRSEIAGSGPLTITGISPYNSGVRLYANNSNFTGKIIVSRTMANYLGFNVTNDFNFGAVPLVETPDSLTFSNNSVMFGNNSATTPVTINKNRGITILSGVSFSLGQWIVNSKMTGPGSASVNVAASSVVTLNNTNDFAGGFSLGNGAKLILGVDNAVPHGVGKGNVTFSYNGIIDLNGHNQIVNGLYRSTFSGNSVIYNSSTTPVTFTIGDNNYNAGSSAYWGVITNGASNGAISVEKIGTGTATLQANPGYVTPNAYSGSTILRGGTLVFDRLYAANEALSGGITLAGGTLSVLGAGATTNTSQTFGNVTLNSGGSGVIVTNRGGNATLTLGNTWTRENGGVALITLTPGSGGTSTLKSRPPLTNEIIGGYVLVRDAAGIGFATTNADGNVVRYTEATPLDAAANLGANTNYVVSGPGTWTLTGGNGTQTVNSLEFNNATMTGGKTLMVGSGGLLFSSSSGYGKTQNLKLTSGSGELDVYVSAGNGQIEGEIKDNGETSVSFVKWGIGTLFLTGGSGVPSYSGNTVVNEGTLSLQGGGNVIPDGVGKGNLVVNGSGAFDLYYRNEVINGLSSASAAAVVKNTGSSSTNVLTLGNNDATASYAGQIGYGGAALTLVKIGEGTQTLSGANTYRGGTILSNGVLSVSSTNNIGGANAKVIFAGGTLRINGTEFNSFGATPLTFTSAGGGLDIADAGNTLTLTNNLGAGTVFVKTGAGVLTLTGTQSGTINTDDSSKIGFGAGLGFYNLGVTTNGVLSPAGSGTVGTLAVNNSLTLAGKLLVDVTASTNDTVTAGGIITLSSGAALEIVNPLLLDRSKRYTLMTAGGGSVSGSLTALNLPYRWKVSVVGNTVVLSYVTPGTMIRVF
jgi:autotransporter-associated beta strand protein